jgi:hypothetical protein
MRNLLLACVFYPDRMRRRQQFGGSRVYSSRARCSRTTSTRSNTNSRTADAHTDPRAASARLRLQFRFRRQHPRQHPLLHQHRLLRQHRRCPSSSTWWARYPWWTRKTRSPATGESPRSSCRNAWVRSSLDSCPRSSLATRIVIPSASIPLRRTSAMLERPFDCHSSKSSKLGM